MTIDTLMERGGLDLAQRWGQGYYCHFPLVHFLNPPSLSDMKGIYFIMWIGKSLKRRPKKEVLGRNLPGALGIALGYKFRLSAILFCGPYWYLLMLDKSYWNNHSYLFGVIGLLFLGSSASNFWYLSVSFVQQMHTVRCHLRLLQVFRCTVELFRTQDIGAVLELLHPQIPNFPALLSGRTEENEPRMAEWLRHDQSGDTLGFRSFQVVPRHRKQLLISNLLWF